MGFLTLLAPGLTLELVLHMNNAQIARLVGKTVSSTPVDDIHTHLYDPAFGPLLLWGIDDLLVYHYLVAEAFRFVQFEYDKFWALNKQEQAEVVWHHLFLENSPISEACRGVLTTLNRLGIDPKKRDLAKLRKWFSTWHVSDYTSHCLDLANVRSVCMTNSPFDDLERPVWTKGFKRDPRFKAALRIDPLLVSWEQAGPKLSEWGYKVRPDLGATTISEIQRFLRDWFKRIQAGFAMVSLPPAFVYPENSVCAQVMERAVIPFCESEGLPFALMLGVKRSVNPMLRMAGDAVGRANLEALENICAAHPKTKFVATVLSRENQHELCVIARKFRNLHIFGCWWFTNIPSVVEEMTRERLELLGLSFTPQHSDARVLDQLIYKWDHSRQVITRVLVEKYQQLSATGWRLTAADVKRDTAHLFGGAFSNFCGANFS